MNCAAWYAPLRDLRSKGSRCERPESLAGLAQAREQHEGQFFTPLTLSRYVWMIVRTALDAIADDGERARILDSSFGSGRLFAFADPARHLLAGVDVDAECVNTVAVAAQSAGFECELREASLGAIRPRGFHVALINPPFSVSLSSPLLEAHAATSFGRYGPHTAALSHWYALDQALAAASVVAAILPANMGAELRSDRVRFARLAALLVCPRGTFREEGTDVDVLVAVFDQHPRDHVLEAVANFDAPPVLRLDCSTRAGSARLDLQGIEEDSPSITLPVTGERSVRITRHLRRLLLRFRCGLTQARVQNAVLRSRLAPRDERYPRGVHFEGEGALDVEVLLAQSDPWKAFADLQALIRSAGGVPCPDAGVLGYLQRRVRQLARERVAFEHWVWGESETAVLCAKAKRTHVLNPAVWGSPVIRAGDEWKFTRCGDAFVAGVGTATLRLSIDQLRERFTLPDTAGWRAVHAGRLLAFPSLAADLRRRAQRTGIDRWLSWDYQLNDLIETYMTPGGDLLCWEQGLGKARLAIALCVFSGATHGLIAVEAYLVDEIERELAALPLAEAQWQVIRGPAELTALRSVNVISYQRLRSSIHPAHPRRTYARALRRRVGVMVADEGSLLAHLETQQTRAAHLVSARRRFVLDGTPIGNYPKDLLALLVWSKGDGTVTQPYGVRRPYIHAGLLASMSTSRRGVDQFREDFIITEWVTNEFAETLQSGAKREIPRIANLAAYRRLLAPHLKRRLGVEPNVAASVRIPQPQFIDHDIRWDDAHLAHYLAIAEEFRQWYLEARRRSGADGRDVNLVATLARIQAVFFAANAPHLSTDAGEVFAPLTSKQRAVLARLRALAAAGHKVVLFATTPAVLDRLAAELAQERIDCVIAHGGRSIADRTADINRRFRDGDTPILLASFGAAAKGLNLWQADRALFYNRQWTAKLESQAARRLCRPQQRREVLVERFSLAGSIDSYMGQHVAFKADAAAAGLDWAAPEFDTDDFLHLDTVLGRFCDELAALRGLKRGELRDHLEICG